MSDRLIPKSVVVHMLRMLDKKSLTQISEVSQTFRELATHPSVCGPSASYTGPESKLPALEAVLQFPPPALVGTTLPETATVLTKPAETTAIPPKTAVFMPVLPEAVPMFAQVPEVILAPGDKTNKVEISQVLPGYAPSYATDYVPSEVSGQAKTFSAFANTISFNVSRYPTLSEVVDSKTYAKRKSSSSRSPVMETPNLTERKETSITKNDVTDLRTGPTSDPSTTVPSVTSVVGLSKNAPPVLEYVPAQYYRGQNSLTGAPTMSVSCAQRVDFVKPDVLASGRLLTNMTAQALSTATATTGLETVVTASLVSPGSMVTTALVTDAVTSEHKELNGNSTDH